jgi:nucleotidyltransferase DUF2204
MPSLADVFRTLNDMVSEGIIGQYAIGGGMAALFYAEALATYDIDVFALIPSQSGPIIRLTEIYEWSKQRGFDTDGEHVVVHTVPVQFLAANEGVENEAVRQARTFDYQGVPVRVMEPEYLAVLSVLAGGSKRRERTGSLFEAEVIDREKLRNIVERHDLATEWRAKWGRDV